MPKGLDPGPLPDLPRSAPIPGPGLQARSPPPPWHQLCLLAHCLGTRLAARTSGFLFVVEKVTVLCSLPGAMVLLLEGFL